MPKKYSKEKLEDLLRKEILLRKPNVKLGYNYAEENYPWFHSFNYAYAGHSRDWYLSLQIYFEKQGLSKEQSLDRIVNIKLESPTGLNGREIVHILHKVGNLEEKPLEQLTRAYAIANYPWYHSFCKFFGKIYNTKINRKCNNDWYGALENYGLFTAKVEKIRKLARNKHNSATSNRFKKYSDEEFEHILDNENLFEKPAEELGNNYAFKNYSWANSFCYKYSDHASKWYPALQNYYETHGLSNEEAVEKINAIRAVNQRLQGRKRKNRQI